MLGTLLKFVGVDLQSHLANLRSQVEDVKRRAIHEAKRQAADTSLTIGLAFVSLIFMLLTVIVGLVALYMWVAAAKGPYAGLLAVGGATAAVAVVFAIVARTRRPLPPQPLQPEATAAPIRAAYSPLPPVSQAVPPRPPFPAFSTSSPGAFFDAVTGNIAHRAAAASEEALDSATEIVRNGSRGAIVATLGVAALVGLLIGRHRRA
jgi:hypothetical protein